MPSHFILTVSCTDTRGIVSSVAGFLAGRGCNILDSAQFGDPDTGLFFMRVEFEGADGPEEGESLRSAFAAEVGARFGMAWEISDADYRPKVMLMVSKFGHCLNDLLYRWQVGQLKMDITSIVSNHMDSYQLAALHAVPFHHLPVSNDTKPKQEGKLRDLIADEGADLVVLARYMQVLSPELSAHLSGRCINIHHSFLPSFKGAKPYQQAYARGVKLIGATAHYVTSDLDEGPIIEQEVRRVDHRASPEDLAAAGHDSECRALARAVRLHIERRVFLNGKKTVVFG